MVFIFDDSCGYRYCLEISSQDLRVFGESFTTGLEILISLLRLVNINIHYYYYYY